MSWPRAWGGSKLDKHVHRGVPGLRSHVGLGWGRWVKGPWQTQPPGRSPQLTRRAACRAPWQRCTQRHQTGPAEEVPRHCG